MDTFLIGLIVIALLVDCYSFKQIKGGLRAGDLSDDGEAGWVACNLLSCLVIGAIFTVLMYYVVGAGANSEGVSYNLEDCAAFFFVIGGIVWVANIILMAIIVNCCLEGYIEYKKGCLRLGVDLKGHVNKFFVTTSKTYYGVQEINGLRYDMNVNLQKIIYNKSWLGTYPYMERVATLVTLPEVKLQKEIISEYVQEYFNARGQYQVDGTELKVLDNKELDVIIVK